MKNSTIRIGDKLVGTMAACADDIEARARAYRSTLMRATLFQIQNAKLELTDADGTVLIGLAPAQTVLAGTQWDAISYNNGKQAVVSLINATSITARFGEDGRLTGHAGCNGYFAVYKVEGRTIVIQPPGSTRRACAEPDGVMEQERLYLGALEIATQYRISGDRLELRNARGAVVAAFIRGGG